LNIKFKPTHIFNGTALLPTGQVLILNPQGVVQDIVAASEAGENVQELGGWLCPGFVNAHCHIELSHLRGKIAKHTGLPGFVEQVINGRTAELDTIEDAMEAAANELYESGTVAVGDICNTTHSIRLKLNSPLYWHNFIEVSGFVDATARVRLGTSQAVLDVFKAAGFENNSSLSPHAPYSVSRTLFQLINERTAGKIISIHNQETAAENELYESGTGDFLALYDQLGIDISGFKPTGASSLQSWIAAFNNHQQIISVHNTFTSEADVDAAKNIGFFCICINANEYIEKTIPPLFLLQQAERMMVVGTDSYASNDSLNVWNELQTIRKHFPTIPLEILLQWATSNGAAALNISDRFGSFEKGKKPGLVLIDTVDNTVSVPHRFHA
jgi:cytosine/adenosine deaminase-related metal-dependent hydrolase